MNVAAQNQVGPGLGPARQRCSVTTQPVRRVVWLCHGHRLMHQHQAQLPGPGLGQRSGHTLNLLIRHLAMPVSASAGGVDTQHQQIG